MPRGDIKFVVDRDFVALQNLNANQRFLKLKEKFCAISQQSSEFQARDPEEFFKSYAQQISLLIECMGDKAAIKWLSDQLTKTVLPLERLLLNLPGVLPERLFLKLKGIFEFNRDLMRDHSALIDWKSILINVSTILRHEPKGEVSDSFASILEPDEFKFALKKVTDYLLGRIYDQLVLDPVARAKINVKKILESISLEYFSLLASDRKSMLASDPHQAVFVELLDRYLKGESIHDFLHDVAQPSEAGKKVAIHNQQIRHFLRKNRINPIVALHYPRVDEFEYKPEGFDLLERKKSEMQEFCLLLQQLGVVAQDELSLLENKKNPENKQVWPAINEIKQKIQEIRKWSKQFFKDEKPVLLLYEISHFDYLEKINDLIQAISGDPYLSQYWFPASRAVLQKFVEIQKCKEMPKYPKTKLKPTLFRIEQWDKEKISTLFLGNEVGCCLAIGSEFSVEILRRIMDDAFLMHVVIESDSGKPVALTWLYFALNPLEEIYLVANFIEINNKYGDEVHARKYIVNALLNFTGTYYLQDNPGIKRFIIAQPSYGYEYFLSFPVKKIALIDKVGGAFCLPHLDRWKNLSRRSKTSRLYYLQSLMKTIKQLFAPFYCYEAPLLKAQSADPLRDLVELGLSPEQLSRWLCDFMLDPGIGFDQEIACALIFLVSNQHFAVSRAVAEIRDLSPYALPILVKGFHLGFTGDFLRAERFSDSQLIEINRLIMSHAQLDFSALVSFVKKTVATNSAAFAFSGERGAVVHGGELICISSNPI